MDLDQLNGFETLAMYRDFFQLDDYPFRLTADTRYFFMGEGHARASAYLNYILHVRDGIGVVTGEAGVGKSMILEHVLAETKEELTIARIQQTQLTTTEFLLAICIELGIEPPNTHKATLIDLLHRHIRYQHFSGKELLLVIDEAHLLKNEVMEELRLLAGLEKFGRKLINIILFGHPSLKTMIGSQFKDAMSQHVRLDCEITPLSEDDVKNYIKFRLWISGGEDSVEFPAETIPLIMEYTSGIPRLVNTLCDMTMMAAFIRKTKFIDLDSVQAAIHKLEWCPYAKRQDAPSANSLSLLQSTEVPQQRNIPRLVIRRHEQVVSEYLLEKDRLVIGRNSRQDIVVNTVKASRFHAQIINVNGTYFIQDMNSTNGTFVNTKKVSWHPLADGEHISIAGFELEYQANSIDEQEYLESSIDELGIDRSELAYE